jgi:hypothetical protein
MWNMNDVIGITYVGGYTSPSLRGASRRGNPDLSGIGDGGKDGSPRPDRSGLAMTNLRYSMMGCMVRSIFQSTRRKGLCSRHSKSRAFSEKLLSMAERSNGPTERISLPNLSTKNSCKKNKTGNLSYSTKLWVFNDGSTSSNFTPPSFIVKHLLPRELHLGYIFWHPRISLTTPYHILNRLMLTPILIGMIWLIWL